MRRHWINRILSTSLTTNPVRQWQDCSLRRHLRLRWRRYDSAPSTDRVKAAPDAFVLQVNSSGWRCWLTQGWLSGTHRHCHGDGSCKAPDQCVVHGEPAEVWVPVAFRVQTHSQTCRHRQTVAFNTRYISFFILPELLLGRSLRLSQRLFIESEGIKAHCLRIKKRLSFDHSFLGSDSVTIPYKTSHNVPLLTLPTEHKDGAPLMCAIKTIPWLCPMASLQMHTVFFRSSAEKPGR